MGQNDIYEGTSIRGMELMAGCLLSRVYSLPKLGSTVLEHNNNRPALPPHTRTGL